MGGLQRAGGGGGGGGARVFSDRDRKQMFRYSANNE